MRRGLRSMSGGSGRFFGCSKKRSHRATCCPFSKVRGTRVEELRRPLPQLLQNLPLRRKSSFFFLREDLLAVDRHDEDAAAAANEIALELELLPDLRRQTGGSGE